MRGEYDALEQHFKIVVTQYHEKMQQIATLTAGARRGAARTRPDARHAAKANTRRHSRGDMTQTQRDILAAMAFYHERGWDWTSVAEPPRAANLAVCQWTCWGGITSERRRHERPGI